MSATVPAASAAPQHGKAPSSRKRKAGASVIDADAMSSWAHRCVEDLRASRDHINSLNVFPIADSDTGSNLLHTMESAVAEVESARAQNSPIAQALAVGSVRGARGNSGMVLSQVLRGVADSANVDDELDAPAFVTALESAVHLVETAIAEPVEGTVLTVLRESAQAAQLFTQRHPAAELIDVVNASVDAAKLALSETTNQLEALKHAGVVDAGATGYVIVVSALRDILAEKQGGETRKNKTSEPSQHLTTRHPSVPAEIEIVFAFKGKAAQLKDALKALGNSLVFIEDEAEDSGTCQVHIHTQQGGLVIETAYALGEVSDLRLEVLPLPGTEPPSALEQGPYIFAFAPQGEIADLYSEAGAIVCSSLEAFTERTHGMNLSASDLVLPNGQLADVDSFETSTPATVVRTGSLVAGVAALSVYSPRAQNPKASMVEAVSAMRVVRPGEETEDAIVSACLDELAQGGEQVTILTSISIDAQRLSERLNLVSGLRSDIDVMVVPVHGIPTEIGVE